jgi:microcystin-dependent protein
MLNKLNFVIGIFFIISIICVILVINVNNKLETFKREKFEDPVEPHHINTESISTLSTLATNIISDNGKQLNLEFGKINLNSTDGNINLNTGPEGGVSIIAFKKMIAPFYIDFTATDKTQIDKLKKRFWYLCDGSKIEEIYANGNHKDSNSAKGDGYQTLNLSGRFILGSGQGTNLTKRDVLATGGEENVTLTTSEMPNHAHRFTANITITKNADNHDERWIGYPDNSYTGSAGSSAAHNNMPPYFVLAYFIYLPP